MKKGDYVLATKFSNGDPGDHFAVGFFERMFKDRYLVVDGNGVPFRANGFRRVCRITPECGDWIIAHLKEIEMGCRSLWYIKKFWKRLDMRT